MPVNLSVKNVPDDLAEKLRQRARLNHRSLQGELMTILEDAANRWVTSFDEADRRIKALGLKTGDDATHWIREMRDSRYGG